MKVFGKATKLTVYYVVYIDNSIYLLFIKSKTFTRIRGKVNADFEMELYLQGYKEELI